MAPPKVVFLMADYGNDPTETATPFVIFKQAGFDISFATEKGEVPKCDEKMISGVTAKLLGAAKPALEHHRTMVASTEIHKPLAWGSSDFSLSTFDLIFLPGGHEKGMRQIITSSSLHAQLAPYMADLQRGTSKKAAAAICHGVQVLSTADANDGSGKSTIHDFETACLPAFMEESIFWATRLFLGNYYKTFGAGTDNVEAFVKKRLDNPDKQYKLSRSMATPFVHEDPKYNYISARFPPDAELLANKTVALVKQLHGL